MDSNAAGAVTNRRTLKKKLRTYGTHTPIDRCTSIIIIIIIIISGLYIGHSYRRDKHVTSETSSIPIKLKGQTITKQTDAHTPI